MSGVLAMLYLIFNEGYDDQDGRRALTSEAIQLARPVALLLSRHSHRQAASSATTCAGDPGRSAPAGRVAEAEVAYDESAQLTPTEAERRYLIGSLRDL